MPKAPMTEAKQAIADRDWWNDAALPGWKLHGWTDRHQATFFREDGSWGEMHMNGELAAEIIRLRDDAVCLRLARNDAQLLAVQALRVAERRISRQRRALAKLYKRRNDKNIRLDGDGFLPGLTAALDTVRNEALQEVLELVKGYEATAYQHGSLPVDPHECAAQVAREIATSIEARMPLTLPSPQS